MNMGCERTTEVKEEGLSQDVHKEQERQVIELLKELDERKLQIVLRFVRSLT